MGRVGEVGLAGRRPIGGIPLKGLRDGVGQIGVPAGEAAEVALK